MKTNKKRSRKLMRVRNSNRVNRLRNQRSMMVLLSSPVFLLVVIALKLNEQTTPEKLLTRLRMHIQKLTGNANFPTTDPTLAEQKSMADDLEGSIDKVAAGDQSEIPVRDNVVAEAEEMIRQLSYNIQYLSKSDEEKIKSAGFEVRKQRGPSVPPGQVLNLVVKPVGPGKIELSWSKDAHSTFYIIESNPNPGINTQWQFVTTSRKVVYVVENLTPGQVYQFRVTGSNGNESGNPSDIAEQRSL